MALSARYSTSLSDECNYNPVIHVSPYHSRTSAESGRWWPEYPVNGSVSSSAKPPQGFGQSDKRSSDSIVNGQSNFFFADDERDNFTNWTYNSALHTYHPMGSYTSKQSECTIEAQASFADVSSINNTRIYDLEEHHTDAGYGAPQYPPPDYLQTAQGWSNPYYDTKGYCDQQAASHSLMHASSDYDDQYSMSNSLHEADEYSKDHSSPQLNHVHVPAELHLSISTASGQVQHVDMSNSLRLSTDHDPMMVDRGNDGCMGMPQMVLHSERPPISSYSELSAHMSYYNSLCLTARQPKTPGLITGPIMALDSKPPNSTTNWQHDASDNVSLTQRQSTPPPSLPKAPIPFEAWSPHQQRKSGKGRSSSVKNEEEPYLPPPRRKRQPSPRSTTRSPSSESRRSRTLSPSSRSQGVLKTIMMKKGGSEPKKQNLACLFCRERKIACGRPVEGSLDPTCNQCERRSLICQYPTESRRGQHKRNAKKGSDAGHGVNRAK